MADLQELHGAGRGTGAGQEIEIAFTSYNPVDRQLKDGTMDHCAGGVLRAIHHQNEWIHLPAGQSHFGYLDQGMIHVSPSEKELGYTIWPEFWFSLPGAAKLWCAGISRGVIVSAPDYRSYLMMGKLEEEGRLRYINGCTDSLLIPPIKLGDPCLNLLYFPPKTDQTMHTHPSDRIGTILSGEGICVTEDGRGRLEHLLLPGMLFCIHAGGKHKFQTEAMPMRVLAYHPDSDYGPTDETHPMINRTMIGGVSASQLTQLHTRKEKTLAEIFAEADRNGR